MTFHHYYPTNLYRKKCTPVGSTIGLLLLIFSTSALSVVEVRLADTPVSNPVKVVDGSSFEAVGGVIFNWDCRTPHFVVRGVTRFDYWDVLLAPGAAFSTRRDYPVGPLPYNHAYVTGVDESSASVNVNTSNYDNNVVTLSDGTILVQTGYQTWLDNVGSPHPAWWDQDYPSGDTSRRVGVQKGVRSLAPFWKVGCKPNTDELNWVNISLLDAAFAGSSEDANGDGKPEIKSGANKDWCALNPPGVAAWDRPELYADPFHMNRVYLTMNCARRDSPTSPTLALEVIRSSDDFGNTWHLGAALPHQLFYAMATTPHGGDRLWLMGEAHLRWSDDAGSSVSTSVIDLPPVTSLALDSNPRTTLGTDRVDSMSPQSLARLGDGKLVAAYRTRVNGVRSYVLVLITGVDGQSPQARPLTGGSTTNKGMLQAKDGGSVFELALVPDLRDTGGGPVVAYWLETSPPPQQNSDGSFPLMKLRARYAVISPFSDRIQLEGDIAEWNHYPTEEPPPETVRRLEHRLRIEAVDGTSIWRGVSTVRQSIPAQPVRAWYGDYFHGTAYPAERPDAMHAVLLWPQDDGLYMRTLTVLDPDYNPERYAAIWRKTSVDRPAILGWARPDFDKHVTEMKKQGYQLREINAFVLPNQGERFNAIWEKTAGERPFVGGWAREDFDKYAAELNNKGYRILCLNAFVLPGQGERFNAIWVKSSADRPYVGGWATTDFNSKITQLQNLGYRLRSVNAFVLPGQGQRFNAIWDKTPSYRSAHWGLSRTNFDKYASELASQGYRVLDVNAYYLPGLGTRFNGVWEKSNADRPVLWGWARNDFNEHNRQLEAQGYRLEQINAVVLP